MTILGIETSCDETSAAIIQDDKVLSNIISSQSVHLQFGGVVPELASRAHLKKIIPIYQEALDTAGVSQHQLDGIAVTCGPGLVGALLVGVNFVKGLSLATGIPFVGVNHIEGHVYSNFLEAPHPRFPFLCLIVSGGHTQLVVIKEHLTYRLIGKTRDDAVGEAYDKVAKLLGLPYPGGPEVDKLAQRGNPSLVKFPIGLEKSKTFDFSYSGLKTAVLNFVQQLSEEERKAHLADICAAFQQAAITALVSKTLRAAKTYQLTDIAVAGGVAANSLLRKMLTEEAQNQHCRVFFPSIQYCTDNAAMIARAGLERLKAGYSSNFSLNAYPSIQLGEEIQ
ncbi:MAG: tRNA (adenosine(37)-N6)-threonylcarbamoyltransferase complex transferase subunit TsaD [Calditrichaeota bacterium]|nr:MAG: tRNA (adenosine(37)-N6)-threonylcarbamoyltransferase complex transferase subunit TsaD [Calditrichota bacterium]